VYEDTDPGIEAARRAGMTVIDVRTLYTPRRVTQRG
jgi:beta-phosphoglucomutase-like phosphatase (HAD superfamily)